MRPTAWHDCVHASTSARVYFVSHRRIILSIVLRLYGTHVDRNAALAKDVDGFGRLLARRVFWRCESFWKSAQLQALGSRRVASEKRFRCALRSNATSHHCVTRQCAFIVCVGYWMSSASYTRVGHVAWRVCSSKNICFMPEHFGMHLIKMKECVKSKNSQENERNFQFDAFVEIMENRENRVCVVCPWDGKF